MAELEKSKTVSPQELMISTLAMIEALAKLLIEKGVITDAEFSQKLLEEREVYQRILNPTTQ
jgi:mannitol/fructose-specific phosphotransferase system IIA component (Ntr-type)